ncbi:hypothetical protein ACLKA7_005872 [Drosophila subpalustris]
MEWYEVELDGSRTCKFPEHIVPGYEQTATRPVNERGIGTNYIGGIINGGKWGWITRQQATDATLMICALDTGDHVARHTFWRENEKKPGQGVRCSIRCVEELFPGEDLHSERMMLLAVCLHVESSRSRTDLIIYTPTCSQLLRYIELHAVGINGISSLKFFNSQFCRATSWMHQFDGCLAVGTEAGAVHLLDVNSKQIVSKRNRNIHCPDKELQRAQVKFKSICEFEDLRRGLKSTLKACEEQDVHLSLQLDMPLDADSAICSILPIEFTQGCAVGLQDGRILIYNLESNYLVTVLTLPGEESPAAVERLCYIVPPDDPKPCFYICAVYKQEQSLMTSLHVLNYRRSVKLTGDKTEDSFQFRDFKSSATPVRLLLDESSACHTMGCDTVSTFPFVGDNGTLLAAISWHSYTDSKNKLILIDINQWYRDELPSHPKQEKPHYLCGYVFSGLHSGLALHIDASTVMHFVSHQRHDEHFYPNSLSFECSLLTISGCRRYAHLGIQRRFLGAMCSQRASLFLNPEPYQAEIMHLRLMPQFSEHNINATFSKRSMYELIFSVALEHNRIGLLNNCVQSCLDGSFMCDLLSETKLSLSILTNWIVKRAGQIKERCAELCHGIFEYGGYSLDDHEREEFQVLNTQLLRLHQLQVLVGQLGRSRLSVELHESLRTTEQTLSVLYEYHRIIYWMIEQEILPEGYEILEAGVPPLQMLQRDYQERRKLPQKLYIDELLHFSGFLSSLPVDRRTVASNLYPPDSLHTLMHLLLLREPQLAHKHELLLYLLLDWDELGSRLRHKQLFPEFVLAFDIAPPLVRSVRSFWLMDRGQLSKSVAELYTGRSEGNNYTDWQMKLLLGTLLANGAVKEAMQVRDLPPGPMSSQLELRVLLANGNIPEAFHHARLHENEETGQPLLEYFFEHCIRSGMFQVLGSLCLRENEEQLVYRLLRKCQTRQTDAVQLILLLKRCKYIEAVSFMDEIAAERQCSEESSTLLSAYRSTMAPVTQSIAGTYFRIRDKLMGDQLRNRNPEPFSCQLAKQNANGQLGGIFQSSALSAHWATRYVHEPSALNSRNMPFLRNAAQARNPWTPQRRLVRPTPYLAPEKRQLPSEQEQQQHSQQAPKRRKLLAEQIGEEVNTFIKRTLHLAQQERKDQKLKLNDEKQVKALLNPPAFLEFKRNSQLHANGDAVRLPVILKRPPAALEQRKSFRFMPPIPLEQGMEMRDGDGQLEEKKRERERERELLGEREVDSMEEEETDEIFMEFEQRPASPMIIEEDAQSEAESEAEYLSPMASANVSFAHMQHAELVRQLEEEEREEREQAERERKEREQEEREHQERERERKREWDRKQEWERNRERERKREREQERDQPMAPPSGPQPRSSLLQSRNPEPEPEPEEQAAKEESSGFGSYHSGGIQVANTCSSLLQLEQFVPPVCSSKMCEIQVPQSSTSSSGSNSGSCSSSSSSSLITSTTTSHVKISERTTICGDLLEPSELMTSPWTMVSNQVASSACFVVPQTSQMLDTTLGMSSYDVTAFEMQPQLDKKDPVEPEQMEQDVEQPVEVAEQQQQEEPEEQLQQTTEMEEQAEQEQEQEQSSTSNSEDEEEPASALDYQRTSPSYSISSELSDMSSTDLVTSRQDPPVYSIVVESTNSITTSRSPTSHTPTSFLPSDTNVSQNSNSSPRAGHGAGHGHGAGAGAAGDGNQRGLYRANSLETVDDLDTTKGSLEDEDDDVDEDEDDCVIALDGTEVRGYVARPEPVAACSSVELFAFKPSNAAREDQGGAVGELEQEELPPGASMAATVANSDSVLAYTINLDSSDDAAVAPPANPTARAVGEDTSNDSVATVHKQQEEVEEQQELEIVGADSDLEIIEPATVEVDSDVESHHSLRLAVSDAEEERKEELEKLEQASKEEEQTQAEDREQEQPNPVRRQLRPRRSVSSASPPPPPSRRIRLRSDDQRPTPSPAGSSNRSTPTLPANAPRHRRLRSNNSQGSEDLGTPDTTTPTVTPTSQRRYRLRSQEEASPSIEEEELPPLRRNLRGGSMPAMSTVPVSTPKRRQKLLPKPLEAIQENEETMPRTRSRARLSQVSTPIPGAMPALDEHASGSGAIGRRRSSRCLSEPPVNAVKPPTGRKRGRASRESTDASAPTPPPITSTDTTPTTTGRVLRSRRSSQLADQEQAPSSSAPSLPASETTTNVNEAHVPPKKRGRNKKE